MAGFNTPEYALENTFLRNIFLKTRKDIAPSASQPIEKADATDKENLF
jgi:hypothetical protein